MCLLNDFEVKLPKVPFGKFRVWVINCFFAVVLVGCGQEENGSEDLEVIDIGRNNQPVVTKVVESSVEEKVISSETVTSPIGSYTLNIGEGMLTLSAKGASRVEIIEDISAQVGFELSRPDNVDAFITTELDSVSLEQLLDSLFSDVQYTIGMADSKNEEGFRIRTLFVGPYNNNATSSIATISENEYSATFELPQASGDIFLGSDLEEVDLAQRLQFGDPDDRATAVGELMMDPAGLNAAYQIFRRDESPAVRLAVLEFIESEDYHLARQMVVASLKDPSNDIVLYALEIIDSLGDFSLVSQVEALMSHHDPEVAEYAKEVRESLTSGYYDPSK